nr:copia protein [Tanacetum cinerariifolium]
MVGAGHAAYTDRFHALAMLVPHLVTLENKRINRNGSIKKNLEKRGNRGEPSKDRNVREDNKRTRNGNSFATTTNHVGRENTGLGGNRPNQVLANNGGQGHGNQGNQARGKAFMLRAEEAHQDPKIVTGTFTLNDHYATTLFDSGADYSFISSTFIPLLGIEPNDLGLAGYYRRFIKNFSKIAKSLTVLTHKSKTFGWGEEQENAFQTLKDKLCNTPVLAFPNGLCQNELNMRQRRWIELFSDYDCKIRYHLGKANAVADALSRKERVKPKRVISMNMTLQSSIKDKILAAQKKESDESTGLQKDLDEMIKLRSDGADRYWWPGMKKDITVYEGIAMDFVTKLPRTSSGHDTIWVIVDRLTKSAYFLPMREDYKMDTLARLYLNEIVARHDLPQELDDVHDTFHVSNLKKCLADPTLQVPLDEIRVDDNLNFIEEPVKIMEKEFKKLKWSRIAIVKVRWNSKHGSEFKWEREGQMRLKSCPDVVAFACVILSWLVEAFAQGFRCGMSFGVATLRAMVHADDKTSRDASSWYIMINGDAKSWVSDSFAYIHCHIAQLSNCLRYWHNDWVLNQTYELTNIIVDVFKYHFQYVMDLFLEDGLFKNVWTLAWAFGFGFLASNKKDKKNEGESKEIDVSKAASKNDPADKIKNIEDATSNIMLKSILKRPSVGENVKAANVTTELGVSLGDFGSVDKTKRVDANTQCATVRKNASAATAKVKSRFEKITRNDDGVYLFKFASKSGMEEVLEKGPWMICKSPIILNKWTPSVCLKKGEVTKVPVWVKLYNVLVLAYSEDGLRLIATQIGKPIMLDAFTSFMCVKSWGRIRFAIDLIEISAHFTLKKEVTMAIPEEEGDGHIKEVIRVEEDILKTSSMVAKSSTMEENEEGFIEVKSRKKKRGADSWSFGGLRLPKPNSKVIWKQKRSVGSKGGLNNASPSDSTNENGGKSSPSNDRPVSDTQISNSFDALNVVREAACDFSVQDPKAKENAKSKCSNLEDLEEESDEDEVQFPNEDYRSGLGGGFSLEEDDLDCYDGYDTSIYDIPGYDIRLNSRRFMNSIHSSEEISVSQNSVSCDVVDEISIPSGSALNALSEEIVAYEQESDETQAVKKLDTLRTPESFVNHFNFDTPSGTVYYIPKVSIDVLLVKGTIYDSVDDCIVAYMKCAAEAGFLVRKSCQKRLRSRVVKCKARVVFNLVLGTTKYKLDVFDTIHNHELEREEYKHFSKIERIIYIGGFDLLSLDIDADLSGTLVDQTKYRSMVGALMYLTSSRPDIMHATCYCAHYQAKPSEKHLTAVKRIFWYLKDTIHMGLWYLKNTGFELTAFSNSDHAGCFDSRKSTSSGIQFLGSDKLVSWLSKKQDCTSMSLAEAEYVSLSACCAQVLLMRTQLTDYDFDKILMYCDSKAAIAISCNPVQHSRTKHIDVRYHFIKEKVEKSIVELFFVETEYQLADMFTKVLPEERFKYLVRRLGMRCLTPEELEVLANEYA